MELPSSFTLAFSKNDIQEKTQFLGKEISPWCRSVREASGQGVLAICILRGAVMFYADLLRSLDASVEVGVCRTWTYSSETNELRGSKVRVSLEEIDVEGRSVLLVDDICDTGRTLKKLHNVMSELGATEVRSAVLIHRLVDDKDFEPTWAAFEYQGPEWFVGYGMEDKNAYANLPDVYSISS